MERMKVRPISTALIGPKALKDCAKLSRRSAVSGGPSKVTSGLAEVSRNARPLAMMNSAPRNTP